MCGPDADKAILVKLTIDSDRFGKLGLFSEKSFLKLLDDEKSEIRYHVVKGSFTKFVNFKNSWIHLSSQILIYLRNSRQEFFLIA